MSNLIKKLPIPISGLMLGAAALGNLVKDHGEIYKNILGIVSAILLVMLIIKLIIYPKCIKKGLDNPVVGGVMATFPMGIMILSTYLVPYSSALAFGLWLAGLAIHIALIIAFSFKYLFKFNIKKVFTTYYIVYVGIVAASISAPAHNMFKLGEVFFWFGFTAYIVLIPIVIYRIFLVKDIPLPALPTLVIQAAPGSLCLAGYLSTFQDKSPVMVIVLLILATVNILIALVYLPKLMFRKFVPAFSAFTFPIVISGIAIKMAKGFYLNSGNPISFLEPSALFLEALSSIIVLFVLLHYIRFMFFAEVKTPKPTKA